MFFFSNAKALSHFCFFNSSKSPWPGLLPDSFLYIVCSTVATFAFSQIVFQIFTTRNIQFCSSMYNTWNCTQTDICETDGWTGKKWQITCLVGGLWSCSGSFLVLLFLYILYILSCVTYSTKRNCCQSSKM